MGNTYRPSAWVSGLLADPYRSDRGAHKWPDVWERGSDWGLAGKTKAGSVNKDESRAGSSGRKRLGFNLLFWRGCWRHLVAVTSCPSVVFSGYLQNLSCFFVPDTCSSWSWSVSSSLDGGQTSAKASLNQLLRCICRRCRDALPDYKNSLNTVIK